MCGLAPKRDARTQLQFALLRGSENRCQNTAPENERVKRDYAFFLEAANGKQSATVDAALYARSSALKSPPIASLFANFISSRRASFRARLVEETGANGKPLSAATIASTLKHLRNFFLWLSREPGFRSALNANDANYFTPSEQDMRVATARREKRVATFEEIKRVSGAHADRDGDRAPQSGANRLRDPHRRSRRCARFVSAEACGHEGANRFSGRARGSHQSAQDLHFHILSRRAGAGRNRRGLSCHAEGRAWLRP